MQADGVPQDRPLTMFAFICALPVAEIVILSARQAIERCRGDAGPRSMQVYFRTNLRKNLVAAAVLTLALEFTAWDQIEMSTTITEWISIFLAYITLRALSFVFNGQIFRGFTDQLCSTPSSDIGTGLALNYWLGFLKFKTMPESGGAGGDTILDELKNFQLSSGLTLSVNKLVILVPSSCDFIKNKAEWKGEYNMELIPAEDSDIQTSNPCKNEKRNQRKGKMRCDFVRICSKKEDDLIIAFDFPQILKSGMSPKKVRQLFKVDYLPSQRRKIVDDFVMKLQNLLDKNEVSHMVQIVRYNDSDLSSSKSIYEKLASKICP